MTLNVRNYCHFNSEYFQETISWQVWPVQLLLQNKLKWLSKNSCLSEAINMKSKEIWKTKTGKWITWSFLGKEKPLRSIHTSQEYSEGGRCVERGHSEWRYRRFKTRCDIKFSGRMKPRRCVVVQRRTDLNCQVDWDHEIRFSFSSRTLKPCWVS